MKGFLNSEAFTITLALVGSYWFWVGANWKIGVGTFILMAAISRMRSRG